MATSYTTPGVYIQEKNAFPNSALTVETSLPVFIGYTQKAEHNGKSLLNTPVRITSFRDYTERFGYGFTTKFSLEDTKDGIAIKGGNRIQPVPVAGTMFYLYNCIRWFFANGGSNCYICSVKTYGDKPEGFIANVQDFIGGSPSPLEQLKKEFEPTLVLAPDAVLLQDDAYTVYREILQHCGEVQSRFGIFDVGYQHENETTDDKISTFRKAIGNQHLQYGAAYYPWLHTVVTGPTEVDFHHLEQGANVLVLLPEPLVEKMVQPNDEELQSLKVSKQYHMALLAASPTYIAIMEAIRSKLNELPPSAAMAGIYTMIDMTRGVFKAPANVSVSLAARAMVKVSHEQQDSLNVDAIEGKSINVIREFPSLGLLVWGARTLDGNSQDWRYINVRRTMMMIEQSVKLAVRSYVFEPNDANTWATVKSMLSNFLYNLWKQGSLAGSTPEDAFSVQVGLGSTMTPEDILEGIMRITLLLAVVRPAEFIIVTLEQQQQQS